MDELTALVLTIAPAKPTVTPGHLGRAAHALLLRLIHERDAKLADALHDRETLKPFTCTTLVGGKRQEQNSRLYLPDEPAWLRFTGMETAVSAQLQALAESPPTAVELDGHKFLVQSATVNSAEHPWAGHTSYEALGSPYLLAHQFPENKIRLAFYSPTTFRRQGQSHPVPLPGWVFGSLLDRWNAFGKVQVAKEMRRYADECMAMSRYRLKTRAVPLKENVVQMGCVGRVEYVCLNKDKYWVSIVNMLADFSFYSGIGYQTTVGLGQVSREA